MEYCPLHSFTGTQVEAEMCEDCQVLNKTTPNELIGGSIFESCPYHLQWLEDGKDISTLLLPNNKYTVWCRKCGNIAPINKDTKEEAIKAWNELMVITTFKLKEHARNYHAKQKEPHDPKE